MADSFNRLELAIFQWLRQTYINSQLTTQIEFARFIKRDWTGVGFYVYFKIPRELEPINLDNFEGNWPINGPNLASNDIQQSGGVVLWGKDGYINCIEMYAYGEFFNEIVNGFELSS